MSQKKRYSGKCKKFDNEKGWGFIINADGSGDVFVHNSEIHANGFRCLQIGELVEFDIAVARDGRKQAVNVTGPNGAYVQGRNNYGSTNTFRSNQYSNNNNNNSNSTTSLTPQYQSRPPLMQTMNQKNMNNNPQLCCIWQWFDDDGAWYNFTNSLNEKMNSSNLATTITYDIGSWTYNFYKMSECQGIQTNLMTGTKRQCRRIMQRKSNFIIPKLLGLTLNKMLCISTTDVPKWWHNENAQSHETNMVEWPLQNEICNEIAQRFHSSLNDFRSFEVEAIYSVQNKFLWKSYQFQRSLHEEAIGTNKLNERYLWHGTDIEAAKNICTQGFLRDYGQVMAYGKGVYFAKNAQYSTNYSIADSNGFQYMFLCRTILGESCQGNGSFTVPPCKPNSSVHYESMVDCIQNPTIFVISKDNQVYPEFVIKFKEKYDHWDIHGKHLSTNNNKTNNTNNIPTIPVFPSFPMFKSTPSNHSNVPNTMTISPLIRPMQIPLNLPQLIPNVNNNMMQSQPSVLNLNSNNVHSTNQLNTSQINQLLHQTMQYNAPQIQKQKQTQSNTQSVSNSNRIANFNLNKNINAIPDPFGTKIINKNVKTHNNIQSLGSIAEYASRTLTPTPTPHSAPNNSMFDMFNR